MRILSAVFPETGTVAAQISGVRPLRAKRRCKQTHRRADAVIKRADGAFQRSQNMRAVRLRGERGKALRDRVDPAGLAFGRADGRAVVEVAAPVPAAVPCGLGGAADAFRRLMELCAVPAFQPCQKCGEAVDSVGEKPRQPHALALSA